jgi:hypothetical protein
LLDATERRVFPRIVVFLGGGLLAQVEVVCQEDDEADTVVLDALAALVEHNLVRRDITEDGEAADARNDSRVRTRRAARAEAIRRRHALTYVDLAETASPQLYGAERTYWPPISTISPRPRV